MGHSNRSLSRRLLRNLARPFKKIAQKINESAQRYVIKTVKMHNARTVSDPLLPNKDALNIDALLLAFLRSGQRHSSLGQPQISQSFATFLASPGRIVTPHPKADFFYCPADEHRAVGLLAGQQFDETLTEYLGNNVSQGETVGLIGDFAGFHALTLANLLDDSGRVCLLEDAESELTRLNLHANLCRNVTRVQDPSIANDLASFNQVVLRIDSNTAIDATRIKQIRQAATQAHWIVYVVDGKRCSPSVRDRASGLLKCLTDQGLVIEQGGLAIDREKFDWASPCRLTLSKETSNQSRAA